MTTKTATLSLAIALVAMPGLSQADSAFHQGNGDVVHITPEHIGKNTPKMPLEPKIHTKTLRGDVPTPQVIEKTDTDAQTRQFIQQAPDYRSGEMKNLYIN